VTIVVTGAAGLLGQHVMSALAASGRPVRGVDVLTPGRVPSGDFVQADLRELGAAVQALAGAEAIVHTAAIPRPTARTAAEVFKTNVLAAHNVAEAALLHGVPRVVSASSFSVLGWPFNPQPLHPAYLPIDEQHPLAPQESYGLSKLVTEEILQAATRRAPTFSALSLRMPWIQTSATFADEVAPRRNSPAAIANLWGYIDAEDAARAFAAALDAPIDGHQAVYLSAPDTFMEEETMSLVQSAFPGVEVRRTLPGHVSVLDFGAAARLLGFAPERSWRDYGSGDR
jgi:nucleoside-diphosphate-sugar epimerase